MGGSTAQDRRWGSCSTFLVDKLVKICYSVTMKQYITHFYLVYNNKKTWMTIAQCDRYPTRKQAQAWGQRLAPGLFDGFVIKKMVDTVAN